jgi:hypothetical protein
LKSRKDSLTFSDVLRKVIILVKRNTRIIFNIDMIFNISTETKEAVVACPPTFVEEVELNGIWAEAAAALPYKIRCALESYILTSNSVVVTPKIKSIGIAAIRSIKNCPLRYLIAIVLESRISSPVIKSAIVVLKLKMMSNMNKISMNSLKEI